MAPGIRRLWWHEVDAVSQSTRASIHDAAVAQCEVRRGLGGVDGQEGEGRGAPSEQVRRRVQAQAEAESLVEVEATT